MTSLTLPSTVSAVTQRVHIPSPNCSVVIEVGDAMPFVAYWGAPIVDADDDATMSLALDELMPRGSLPGGLDQECAIGLVPMHGDGWVGRPGLQGHRRGGTSWAPRFKNAQVIPLGGGGIGCVVTVQDDVAELELALRVELCVSGALSIQATIRNVGLQRYSLDALTITLPMPRRATRLTTFHGRWCKEMRRDTSDWKVGAWTAENRRGRTSHEYPPLVFAQTDTASAVSGEVWALHTAWSGNHVTLAERLADGRRYIQMGELLHSGEICLEAGETYTTPRIVGAYSSMGDSGVAQVMQAEVRSMRDPLSSRPVTLNTWEAVYFNHEPDTLHQLAHVAADVGVERFVLDDGWFLGRRNDSAGLGDWYVDPVVYPHGLAPLIDTVKSRGMQFGLWLEPEMLNPDSDLYRAHPDWVLEHAGYPHVLGRHQLVLNLTIPEAYEYILRRIDALLTEHDISYLKWDMNRPHVAAANPRGTAATHAQTKVLYMLLDEIRFLHPGVEIESCSSGGGRIDHEILRRTERVWTSDTNDPILRQAIQHHTSLLVPPEMMGCHIGAPTAHTTNKTSTLTFRAITAMFGHLGIEWNLLHATPTELEELRAVVALHKELRHLLHSGQVIFTTMFADSDGEYLAHGVASTDLSRAVMAVSRLLDIKADAPPNLRIVGLDHRRQYKVSCLLGQPLGGDYVVSHHSGYDIEHNGLEILSMPPESAVLLMLESS